MASFGKKTLSPGYIPQGGNWVLCQVCGFAIRSKDMLIRWDGLKVCPEDYDKRHPQDLIKGVKDDQGAKGITNPEPGTDKTTSVSYDSSVTGSADAQVPSGTFDLS